MPITVLDIGIRKVTKTDLFYAIIELKEDKK